MLLVFFCKKSVVTSYSTAYGWRCQPRSPLLCLRVAALSSRKLGNTYEGLLKNDYLYNEKELLEDADLNWYDYGFRFYDPQIGRFPQLDPLTHSYPHLTPYQYASCDPITNIDVDGLEGTSAVKNIVSAATSSVSDIPIGALAVVKELAPAIIPATKTAVKTAASIGIKSGLVINSAIKLVNTLNIVETKSITCHGAYQNGYNPYGSNGSNYDGLVFSGQGYGPRVSARLGKNPDPVPVDISLLQRSPGGLLGPDAPSRYLENLERVTEYIKTIEAAKSDAETILKNNPFKSESTESRPMKYVDANNIELANPYKNPKAVIYDRYNGLKTKKQGTGRVITSEPATDTFPLQRGYGAYYPIK